MRKSLITLVIEIISGCEMQFIGSRMGSVFQELCIFLQHGWTMGRKVIDVRKVLSEL
jgi:hypothetical protein